MTMFGRDSILTSLQALPFTPELAAATCCWHSAAGRGAEWTTSATRTWPHPPRDAPWRIDRLRGAAALAVLRRRRCDAAVRRPARRVRALVGRPQARARARARGAAALNWTDEYADLQGNGYISYQRRNEQTGLENQCWKDRPRSPTATGASSAFRAPRASCRATRGDAKLRGARLAREIWNDSAYADQLERQAADLSAASTATSGSRTASTLRSPWTTRASRSTPHRQQRPPTLERHRRQVEGEGCRRPPARATVFSGWGAISLAEGEGRYNPIGYHVGTVYSPSIPRSSPGAFAATASSRRPPSSPAASSTPPRCSKGACPRPSVATNAA